jgi:hypothetical protein
LHHATRVGRGDDPTVGPARGPQRVDLAIEDLV